MCRHSTALSKSDVRALCLGFPDLVEKIRWRQPAWFARTMFARMYDEDTLSVKSEESLALIHAQAEPSLVDPYGRGDESTVLVLLGRIDRAELEELLIEPYRLASI